MSTEEKEEFVLDGEKEIVRDFVFLGAKIEYSGSSRGENNVEMICIRESGNDRAIQDMEIYITITTKCRILNALAFPVLLYGCDSWTIRKAERRRIDSFELWCWRRLIRISWTARRTNKSVIKEIKSTSPLEALTKKQQLSYPAKRKGPLCWEWVEAQERLADHENAGKMTSMVYQKVHSLNYVVQQGSRGMEEEDRDKHQKSGITLRDKVTR